MGLDKIALVTFRLRVTVTAFPPVALIVKTGLLGSVEPLLRATVPPVAATELATYSIPLGSVTSNSALFFPAGILNVIVSAPAEKSVVLAKCTGLSAVTPLIVCAEVLATHSNKTKLNNLMS